jgi:hypothetical protein
MLVVLFIVHLCCYPFHIGVVVLVTYMCYCSYHVMLVFLLHWLCCSSHVILLLLSLGVVILLTLVFSFFQHNVVVIFALVLRYLLAQPLLLLYLHWCSGTYWPNLYCCSSHIGVIVLFTLVSLLFPWLVWYFPLFALCKLELGTLLRGQLVAPRSLFSTMK